MHSRHSSGLVSLLILGAYLLTACTGTPSVAEAAQSQAVLPPPIIAIGDLHGDLEAARKALLLAGAMDENDSWIGGNMILVQTGDILDRGDDEEAILDLFERLRDEAKEAGGAVHLLHGNHELMNVYLDYRYVTEGGFSAFGNPGSVQPDSLLATLDSLHWSRASAFRPGGPLAKRLANRSTVAKVGNTIFVHGGLLPEHVDLGMDNVNAAVRAWLLDEAPQPEWVRGDQSPVWSRLYSDQPTQAACDTLSSVLERVGADRMVVGHTAQPTGITSFCGGRVWCIDVGMAAYYKGRPEVLEIRGDAVRSLR